MTASPSKFALRLIYGGPLVLVFLSLLLRYQNRGAGVWSDWKLLCPALQLVFVVLVIVGYRQNRTVWMHALITTGFIGLMTVAIVRGRFDYAVFFIADIAVHVVVPICWLLTLVGGLAVPFLLRRRKFLPLKLWVLIASTLLTAESGARFLEPSHDFTRDILPNELPEPPRNEIHVAAIGGSSTLGHPYHPKFGFPQVIAWRLERLYPNRKIVLHNLAKGGLNLRLAARELNRLSVRPQLLLIYSGHNEFYHDLFELQRTTASRLPFVDPWMRWSAMFRMSKRWVSEQRADREMRKGQRFLYDEPIALPLLYQRRLERFRNQCQQLSAVCRRHRIKPIWFIPAASEAGFEPNRSGNRMRLAPAKLAEIDEIGRAARAMNCELAAEQYRRVLSRYPDFAEMHFRLAECLRETGDVAAARYHFAEALNHDGHPIRTNRDYREVIRETARASHDPLVDTIEVLRTNADDQILGRTLFHDNVHMTLKGYYLTGLAGCEAIIQSKTLVTAFGPPKVVTPLTLADAIKKARLDRADLARAYRRTAFGFREMKRWRFDGTSRHRQFLRYEELADALESGRIDPGQDGVESLTPE